MTDTAAAPAERSKELLVALSTSLDVLNDDQKKLIADNWKILTDEEKTVLYDYVKDVKEGLELPGQAGDQEPSTDTPATPPAGEELPPADPSDPVPGAEAPATPGTSGEQTGTEGTPTV